MSVVAQAADGERRRCDTLPEAYEWLAKMGGADLETGEGGYGPAPDFHLTGQVIATRYGHDPVHLGYVLRADEATGREVAAA